MNEVLQFVLQHGYLILFGALFAHQLGFPLPGPLFLLAAGALVAAGRLDLVSVLGLAVAAIVLADWPWYEAGRRWGDRVVHFIHRLTRDPDYHDRRAKEAFARYGPSILLVSKFVPGLDAVAPPLAGTSRTSFVRFLIFDAAGATLYSSAYTGLGYVFSDDLDRVAAYVGQVGEFLAGVAFTLVLVWIVAKLVRSYRILRESRLARTTPTDTAGRSMANARRIADGLNHADLHRTAVPGKASERPI